MRFLIVLSVFLVLVAPVFAQTIRSSQFTIEKPSFNVDTESAIDSSSYSISSDSGEPIAESFDKNGYVARVEISTFRLKLSSSIVDFNADTAGTAIEKSIPFTTSSEPEAQSHVTLDQISPFSSFSGTTIPSESFSYKVNKNSAMLRLTMPNKLPQGSFVTNLLLSATPGY